MPEIDPSFTALPLDAVTSAGLSRASELGCRHAEVRVERIRSQLVVLRDGQVETSADDTELGVGVRVVRDGAIGFAASAETGATAAARLAERAAELAMATAGAQGSRIELAEEPSYGRVQWVAPYEVDPTAVALADKVAVLEAWSRRLLASPVVDHVTAAVLAVAEDKHYADLAGTTTTQRRVRTRPVLEAFSVDRSSGTFESMRTLAPPAGRGFEYLAGNGAAWDWDAELDAIPGLLDEKRRAPSVEPGTYDLVIDPSNLWLTIHESVGHATELDRALGDEAAYAGTSFATFDQLGSLRYGSPVMHVTGDRTTPYGLATIGYDDEGVAGQRFDIVRDGVLVGYQLDRRMAAECGLGRSNGCAFASAAHYTPIQRMANVSLQPADGEGPTLSDLVGEVERGIYIVGDKSWSIDMQRHNFQFTGQRFYRIEGGRLAGQLKDVAYQARTTDFWGSLAAVGGRSTYVLGGAFNCGKGQPSQVAPVSHGCPVGLFRGVRILNTREEQGL
ncbi:MAG: TldD/PmbA family protein [Acidimicrobiales bacterium]|nr:TldD/PmbA family protein [Acidimicrobiales bacterium]